MILDFEKLNAGTTAKQTDPRKIFTTLQRDPRFKRPLDEQADVLDAWYERRTAKDLTIKMNTGGGKTVVGLLCLQSALNENVKPAVYITPDNFLLDQVVAEAHALGIAVTTDENDIDFLAGRSILIANVFKLFNGRSVFGVGQKKISIGCIVIDDAHACLNVVGEQFSIKSDAGTDVYDGLLTIFENGLKAQSPTNLLDLKANDPSALMPVPYWDWQSHQADVIALLHKNRTTEELKWSWPLIKDCIPLCSCVFGGGHLEIAPHFVPIECIPSFSDAKRRIYMTATLADDTILVSNFKADVAEVVKPIRPKGGGDIGDRLILAPQEINPGYSIDEIKALVVDYATHLNVVVIVPSAKRMTFWSDVANQILDKHNIQAGVELLKQGHVGLTVLMNKYDGIDLPGDACRLLIIDGLPEVYGLRERQEIQYLDGTKGQLVRQVQRIEQGMGRGVRSSDDHCVILLLGGKLTQKLHLPEAEEMFSSATRAQINLGKQVADQVRGKPIGELKPIINLCLTQNEQWVQAGRNAIVNAPQIADSHLDKADVKLREAFDASKISRNDISINKVQEAINGETESKLKGYLKQKLAEYTNFTNPSAAQELQLAALRDNSRLLRPLAGVTFRKLNSPTDHQAILATQYMGRFLEGNDLIIWMNALLDDLDWGEEGSRRFEAAMWDLASFLGFGSQRPEELYGRGPDNLWALGGLKYLVIECKSGAESAQKISKHDTNQLTGSMKWFEDKYDNTCSATPIIVHPKTVFEHAATPHENVRIINAPALERLRKAIELYAISLATSGGFTNAVEVERQLTAHNLLAKNIVEKYTVEKNAR